jgi:glutathione S-transferase
MAPVSAKLYVIPASHPSRTAWKMLEYKGIPFKRRDLIPVVSKGMLRAAGFPGVTVPALKLDGERVQGSREIARALDRVQPEPPLFPADAAARAAVEEAETWGDEVLQPLVRRVLWNGMRRDRKALRSYSEGAKLGVPVGVAVRTSAPIVAMSARFNEATDEQVRADIAALPATVQRVDDWIAAGVIGNDEPNAADFQIGSSLCLLLTIEDVRPAIDSRPAGKLARRIDPEYPGHMPPILPVEWLDPLPAGAAAQS